MLDNFIIVKGDESGNITIHLSNYAAWALLRRLKDELPADATELEFVTDTVEQIKNALS